MKSTVPFAFGVVAFATALTVAPAPAQPTAQGPISGLSFAIEVGERTTDPQWLTSGGRFVVPPGERRVIRAAADGVGRRVYPSVTYTLVAGGEWLDLDEPHPSMGTVRVTAIKGAGKDRVGTIAWALAAGFVPANGVTRGTLEVASSASADGNVDVSAPATPREIVGDLYRGILLREPDPGAQGFIDTVGRDGWNGVLRVAGEIATSIESRTTVYQKGATNETRLVALYRHLQDRTKASVPVEEWNRNLGFLNNRQYEVVVNELLALRPERLSRVITDLDRPVQ